MSEENILEAESSKVNMNKPNADERYWLQHYHQTGEMLPMRIGGVVFSAEQMLNRCREIGAKV